jgi:hypothetical protein
MDNYNGESLATLMHKLTKYQSLLAGTKDSKKSETYKYKIMQYTGKLSKLGVNTSSLNQMGGFGMASLEAKKAAILAAIDSAGQHNLDELNGKITALSEAATQTNDRKNKILKEYTDFTTKAMTDLDDVNNKIASMKKVDVSSQGSEIDAVKTTLSQMFDEDIGKTIDNVILGTIVGDVQEITKMSDGDIKTERINKAAKFLKTWGAKGTEEDETFRSLKQKLNADEQMVLNRIKERLNP